MARTSFRDCARLNSLTSHPAFPLLGESERSTIMTSRRIQERCNSSMQLTRAADYAVRVMVYLTTVPREVRVLLPTLAEATDTPVSFLSKVLQALARAQLIWSQRGVSGGFEISERGRKASMREVIEAIDGPIRLNVCTAENDACARSFWCPAHPVWVRAQRALLHVLEDAKIADLATHHGAGPCSEELRRRRRTKPMRLVQLEMDRRN